MRQIIKNFVELCANNLPVEGPIYEFGAFQVLGQEGFADLRPYFAGTPYVGCDMRAGTGVDLVLDLHQIDLPDQTAGMVICMDTLEHVEDPRQALTEIHRIVKPHGIAIISSVMNFPIHDHPHDYWRFTPQAFASILKPFATVLTDYAGEEWFPHTVVGIGIKGKSVAPATISQLQTQLLQWRQSSFDQLQPTV